MTCAFCPLEAHGPCAWPVERFYTAMAMQIEAGDTIRRWKESPRDQYSIAVVEAVSRPAPFKVVLDIFIRHKNRAQKDKRLNLENEDLLRVKRVAPCGLLACEQHLAARGPGIYHCKDHWLAWEQVA